MFDRLQGEFPEYYNGQTIRIWRKKDERQEFIFCNMKYPVISNLLQKFEKRFDITEWVNPKPKPIFTKDRWYLIHEFYWTLKA